MTHTMRSSVCIECNVLCILVAREETNVMTPLGLPKIGFNDSKTKVHSLNAHTGVYSRSHLKERHEKNVPKGRN